jgi:acetyltransferase-like isoleucine patch superfamily enzyme
MNAAQDDQVGSARRALDRVIDVAGERLVEPWSAYTHVTEVSGVQIFSVQPIPEMNISGPPAPSNNFVFLGHGCSTRNLRIAFRGNNNVAFVGPYASTGAVSANIDGTGSIFYVGAFTTVGSMTVMLTGPNGAIVIGDFCMLSSRIIASNSDGHAIYDAASGARINFNKDVMVDDHVWIGRDVRLSKGAEIGSDSIIAQSAVVSGRVPKASIFAGTPARLVRENVTWSRMSCGSLSEMEETERHQAFLRRVAGLRNRIGALRDSERGQRQLATDRA